MVRGARYKSSLLPGTSRDLSVLHMMRSWRAVHLISKRVRRDKTRAGEIFVLCLLSEEHERYGKKRGDYEVLMRNKGCM